MVFEFPERLLRIISEIPRHRNAYLLEEAGDPGPLETIELPRVFRRWINFQLAKSIPLTETSIKSTEFESSNYKDLKILAYVIAAVLPDDSGDLMENIDAYQATQICDACLGILKKSGYPYKLPTCDEIFEDFESQIELLANISLWRPNIVRAAFADIPEEQIPSTMFSRRKLSPKLVGFYLKENRVLSRYDRAMQRLQKRRSANSYDKEELLKPIKTINQLEHTNESLRQTLIRKEKELEKINKLLEAVRIKNSKTDALKELRDSFKRKDPDSVKLYIEESGSVTDEWKKTLATFFLSSKEMSRQMEVYKRQIADAFDILVTNFRREIPDLATADTDNILNAIERFRKLFGVREVSFISSEASLARSILDYLASWGLVGDDLGPLIHVKEFILGFDPLGIPSILKNKDRLVSLLVKEGALNIEEHSEVIRGIEGIFYLYLHLKIFKKKLTEGLSRVVPADTLSEEFAMDYYRVFDKHIKAGGMQITEISESIQILLDKVIPNKDLVGNLANDICYGSYFEAIDSTTLEIIRNVLSDTPKSLSMLLGGVETFSSGFMRTRNLVAREMDGSLLTSEIIELLVKMQDDNFRETIQAEARDASVYRDLICKPLLFFSSINLAIEYVKVMILAETKTTYSLGKVFQDDDPLSLSVMRYLDFYGDEFIRKTLRKIFSKFSDRQLLFDVSKTGEALDIARKNTILLFSEIVDGFARETKRMPDDVVYIGKVINESVKSRFPDSTTAIMTGYIFLGMVRPNLMNPSKKNIFDLFGHELDNDERAEVKKGFDSMCLALLNYSQGTLIPHKKYPNLAFLNNTILKKFDARAIYSEMFQGLSEQPPTNFITTVLSESKIPSFKAPGLLGIENDDHVDSGVLAFDLLVQWNMLNQNKVPLNILSKSGVPSVKENFLIVEENVRRVKEAEGILDEIREQGELLIRKQKEAFESQEEDRELRAKIIKFEMENEDEPLSVMWARDTYIEGYCQYQNSAKMGKPKDRYAVIKGRNFFLLSRKPTKEEEEAGKFVPKLRIKIQRDTRVSPKSKEFSRNNLVVIWNPGEKLRHAIIFRDSKTVMEWFYILKKLKKLG